MPFGMAGNADMADAVRLQKARGGDIAAGFERPLGGGDVACDQEQAADVGLTAQPRDKIIQRLARGDFARRDMRHRLETGASQGRRGLDIGAEIVAGQEGDGHFRAGGKLLAQPLELTAVRGNLHRGGSEQRYEAHRMRSRALLRQAGVRRREIT